MWRIHNFPHVITFGTVRPGGWAVRVGISLKGPLIYVSNPGGYGPVYHSLPSLLMVYFKVQKHLLQAKEFSCQTVSVIV